MQILSNPMSALNYANSRKFRVLKEIAVEPDYDGDEVTSDFRPEVEIWPFRACTMHPAIIIGTVRSLWTWLWGRYHVLQYAFLTECTYLLTYLLIRLQSIYFCKCIVGGRTPMTRLKIYTTKYILL